MSKYSWSKVPSWVNYVFTDQDGDVFGCDNKPTCDGGTFNGHPRYDKWYYLGKGSPEDYENSLEDRPR